jgi:hypothetical protein
MSEYGSKIKVADFVAGEYARIRANTPVPLITNLRFTRTHAPVRLRADFPLAQVQPVPRIAHADETLGSFGTTADMSGLSPGDWDAYRNSIADPSADPDRNFGAYAVTARKRARSDCPCATVSA